MTRHNFTIFFFFVNYNDFSQFKMKWIFLICLKETPENILIKNIGESFVVEHFLVFFFSCCIFMEKIEEKNARKINLKNPRKNRIFQTSFLHLRTIWPLFWQLSVFCPLISFWYVLRHQNCCHHHCLTRTQ